MSRNLLLYKRGAASDYPCKASNAMDWRAKWHEARF